MQTEDVQQKNIDLMKFLFGLIFASFALSVSAQTAVIHVKSHQGDLASIPDASDNFGEIAPPPVYDTVIKIDENCVIQIGSRFYDEYRFRDTVCGHWYYEQANYSEGAIQEYHGENTVLIGFEENNNSRKDSPFGNRKRRQSSPILFILITIVAAGAYIARPAFAK